MWLLGYLFLIQIVYDQCLSRFAPPRPAALGVQPNRDLAFLSHVVRLGGRVEEVSGVPVLGHT